MSEFGPNRVNEQEVLDFGKRYVPLYCHLDRSSVNGTGVFEAKKRFGLSVLN